MGKKVRKPQARRAAPDRKPDRRGSQPDQDRAEGAGQEPSAHGKFQPSAPRTPRSWVIFFIYYSDSYPTRSLWPTNCGAVFECPAQQAPPSPSPRRALPGPMSAQDLLSMIAPSAPATPQGSAGQGPSTTASADFGTFLAALMHGADQMTPPLELTPASAPRGSGVVVEEGSGEAGFLTAPMIMVVPTAPLALFSTEPEKAPHDAPASEGGDAVPAVAEAPAPGSNFGAPDAPAIAAPAPGDSGSGLILTPATAASVASPTPAPGSGSGSATAPPETPHPTAASDEGPRSADPRVSPVSPTGPAVAPPPAPAVEADGDIPTPEHKHVHAPAREPGSQSEAQGRIEAAPGPAKSPSILASRAGEPQPLEPRPMTHPVDEVEAHREKLQPGTPVVSPKSPTAGVERSPVSVIPAAPSAPVPAAAPASGPTSVPVPVPAPAPAPTPGLASAQDRTDISLPRPLSPAPAGDLAAAQMASDADRPAPAPLPPPVAPSAAPASVRIPLRDLAEWSSRPAEAVTASATPTPPGSGGIASSPTISSGSLSAPPAQAVETAPLVIANAAPEGESRADPMVQGGDAASMTPTPSVRDPGLTSALSRGTLEATVQIAAQIQRRLEGRSTRFEMALTPDELGRVDVRLDIDTEGRLAARLAFDNPAAATDLRGRADELRRQLEAAGFQMADDALEFTGRDSGSSAFDRGQEGGRQPWRSPAGSPPRPEIDVAQPPRWMALSLTPAGVDMKV